MAARPLARKKAPSNSEAPTTRPRPSARWSQRVTETSDALTLEDGVFKGQNPKTIARSLKRSSEASHRRKADPYRSAMSMLTFYINRGGNTLPAAQKRVLEQAKVELRKLFHRETA
jgi:Protein of unknown function (DUF3175)